MTYIFRNEKSPETGLVARHNLRKGVFGEQPRPPRFEWERGHTWSPISRHANWREPGDLKPVSQVAAIVPRHVFYRIQIKTMTGRHVGDDAI